MKSKHMILNVLTMICLCALGLQNLAAQGNPAPWDVAPMTSDPRVLADAVKAIPTQTGTEVQVIKEDEQFRFDAQGRVDRVSYNLYRVLTQKGAENWSDISAYWAPWNEDRPVIEARVILADGSARSLDASTMLESSPQSDDGKIYSDRKSLSGPLPAVAPGVVVEIRITYHQTKPLFSAGTTQRVYMGSSAQVIKSRVVLEYPKTVNLIWGTMLMPGMVPVKSENQGMVRLEFEARDLKKWKSIDPNLPSDQLRRPGVIFTTGSSWQALAKAYSEQVDQKLANAKLAGIAKNIAANAGSTEEKISAVISWMAKEIRYTGIEFGESAYIPYTPQEVLDRKFGDCKDKASLTVALLRELGLKASVALLRTGPGQDVDPAYPGMGLFDHAIVFVDHGSGIWIDATDNFARLGELPTMDQGRYALVASGKTTGLVIIPQASSKENFLRANDEIRLQDYGPAKVMETNTPGGYLQSRYRAFFAFRQEKDRKDWAKSVIKDKFKAEKLDRMNVPDPNDLSVPFNYSVEVSEASRGFTDLDAAVYFFRYEGLFERMPDAVLELYKAEKDTKADQETDEDAKPPRTADWVLTQAYREEYTIKVIPPAGFTASVLPENRNLELGPALLTETFSKDPSGAITGTITFDTRKARFTDKEARAFSQAAADLQEKPALAFRFETSAGALLEAGKPTEAFKVYQDMIKAEPAKAIHHLRYARALLGIGLGEAARTETRKAVELEPKSNVAWNIRADVLRFDRVGRRMRVDADLPGARAAYLKAMEFDPEDHEAKANLAIMYEYNDRAERYAKGAELDKAIKLFRELGADVCKDLGVGNNLVIDLVFHGEFDEALKEADTMEAPPMGAVMAAIAATKGVQAAIDLTRRFYSSESDRGQVLAGAAEFLLHLRKYPEASLLYAASANGDSASQTKALAATIRKLVPHEQLLKDTDTPVHLVQKFMVNIAMDAWFSPAVKECLASAIIKDLEGTEEEAKEALERLGGSSLSAWRSSGLPPEVVADLLMQMVDFKVDGNDALGYRVRMKIQGSADVVMAVIKEAGAYKLLDTLNTGVYVARLASTRAETGDLTGARKLLDWLREEWKGGSVDDPLSGAMFPRFWTKGQDGDKIRIQTAAAMLLTWSKTDSELCLKSLNQGLAREAPGPARDQIQESLLRCLQNARDSKKALPLAEELFARYPYSDTAFSELVNTRLQLKDIKGAEILIKPRLDNDPQDHLALSLWMRAPGYLEDFNTVEQRCQKIMDDNNARDEEFNLLAWNSLFTNHVSDQILETMLKSIQGNKNQTSFLHTLACLYIEKGRMKEAYDILIQSMDLMGQETPNSDYRYAFGRIAELCNLLDIAKDLYTPLKLDETKFTWFWDTTYLAQRNLKALKAAGK